MKLWVERRQRYFPSILAQAIRHTAALQHREAQDQYLIAASLAPNRWYEQEMLRAAWIAHVKIQGGISDLELQN